MKKQKIILIIAFLAISGLLLTYSYKNDFLRINKPENKYFFIAKTYLTNSVNPEEFLPSAIVKNFNKAFETKYRYISYNEVNFWENTCQSDIKYFEFGLMSPFHFACYKKRSGTDRVVAIAKQSGCTPSIHIISLDNKKINPAELNGKTIGFLKGNNNLVRIFLNEPTFITPGNIVGTDSLAFLIHELEAKKIDYIVSLGIQLNDEHFLIRFSDKKQKVDDLNFGNSKLHVNYSHNIEMPCVVLAGNSENSLISSESAKKDFIAKINNQLTKLNIDKFSLSEDPFVPMSAQEIEGFNSLVDKATKYTFNVKSDGDSRGNTEKLNQSNNPNFQPDNGIHPPEGTPPSDQVQGNENFNNNEPPAN